jgi:hypothetical protein
VASREHSLRVRIASEYSRRNPDPDLIAELQRERATVRIETFARKVLAGVPSLTGDQRRRLAAVMLEDGAADVTA